jgi:hypothetical protein
MMTFFKRLIGDAYILLARADASEHRSVHSENFGPRPPSSGVAASAASTMST